MSKLVLVRHGESIWNLENRFTGWTDVSLSKKGIEEAKDAGKLLVQKHYVFDIAFTSVLCRANKTLEFILAEMNLDIPVVKTYKLNERHYGALQGLNKKDTALKYGEEQVHIWRRSYNIRPPLLSLDDPRAPKNDSLYKDIDEKDLPLGESLEDTVHRVIPFYESVVVPYLKDNKNVLIVAHGNSLRALIKYLENLNELEIVDVEIPTGKPLCYELDENLKILKKYYIGEGND